MLLSSEMALIPATFGATVCEGKPRTRLLLREVGTTYFSDLPDPKGINSERIVVSLFNNNSRGESCCSSPKTVNLGGLLMLCNSLTTSLLDRNKLTCNETILPCAMELASISSIDKLESQLRRGMLRSRRELGGPDRFLGPYISPT